MHTPATLPDGILSIEFPMDGKARIRSIVRSANNRATIKHVSPKVGRMVHCESRNEANCCWMLDAAPNVLWYTEQPCRIHYVLDGKKHTHVPDFMVRYSNRSRRSALWEVKSEAEVALPEYQKRTKFLVRALPDYGFSYIVAPAEVLAHEPNLSNLKELAKHGVETSTSTELAWALSVIRRRGGIRWKDARRSPHSRKIVAALVFGGYLNFDRHKPLAPGTLFSVTSEFGQER